MKLKLAGQIRRKHIWQPVALLAITGLLFTTTNASTAPSYVVIVGFLLLATTIYYLTYGLIKLSGVYGLSIKRKRALAIYMTAVLAGLIALQSIGELGSRDILVLLPLALLAYLYSAYAKTGRNLSG